jgi:hypothetical protein
LPITGILCDGDQFRFFEFVKIKETGSPQFSLGEFDNGDKSLDVTSPSMDKRNYDTQQAVLQIRSACEALYFVFLRAYSYGLQAYWNRSVELSKAEGKERVSTPMWKNAITMAGKALEEAKSAWVQYDKGELKECQITAERAVKHLIERYRLHAIFSPRGRVC